MNVYFRISHVCEKRRNENAEFSARNPLPRTKLRDCYRGYGGIRNEIYLASATSGNLFAFY